MREEFKQFYNQIVGIFKEYTLNSQESESYIKRLDSIKTNNSYEDFYKSFILCSIYLNLEQYNRVLENAQACLKLYETFQHVEKQESMNEYLFAKYHAVVLNEYFHPDNTFKNNLEILKRDMEKQGIGKNTSLKVLYDKIELYFNIISKDNQYTINHVEDMDYNVFKFWYENLASKIFSEKDNQESMSHYTRLENSFNILKFNEIWVSRQDFLNDRSELTYFKKAYPQLINETKIMIESDPDFTIEDKEFLKNQIAIIDKIVAYMFGSIKLEELSLKERNIVDIRKEYFVLSCSKNHDSLALWGNYTEFTGVNLLIDRKELTTALEDKNFNPLYMLNPKNNVYKNEIFSNFYYGEVLYDLDEVKIGMFRDFKAALKLHKENYKVIKEFVVTRILIELIRIRMLFTKGQDFKCEEEYRFVFTVNDALYDDKVNFRSSRDYFIPYIKIPLNLDTIKEIMVGPRNNSDLVFKGFLEYFNYRKVKISVNKSSIPFR